MQFPAYLLYKYNAKEHCLLFYSKREKIKSLRSGSKSCDRLSAKDVPIVIFCVLWHFDSHQNFIANNFSSEKKPLTQMATYTRAEWLGGCSNFEQHFDGKVFRGQIHNLKLDSCIYLFTMFGRCWPFHLRWPLALGSIHFPWPKRTFALCFHLALLSSHRLGLWDKFYEYIRSAYIIVSYRMSHTHVH